MTKNIKIPLFKCRFCSFFLSLHLVLTLLHLYLLFLHPISPHLFSLSPFSSFTFFSPSLPFPLLPPALVSHLLQSIPPPFLQRIKAVAAPVRGGASSRPADHRGLKELSYPLDPNGNKGLLKAPTHTIVETMM